MEDRLELTDRELKEIKSDSARTVNFRFGGEAADEPLDWERARKHLNRVKAAYESLRNTPGVNPNFGLHGVIYPLETRYARGERTQELFDEIMDLE